MFACRPAPDADTKQGARQKHRKSAMRRLTKQKGKPPLPGLPQNTRVNNLPWEERKMIMTEEEKNCSSFELETETISFRQWDNYAKRIETANLKACGASLTYLSISIRARKYIVEERSDNKTMIVRKGWREAMKQARGQTKNPIGEGKNREAAL